MATTFTRNGLLWESVVRDMRLFLFLLSVPFLMLQAQPVAIGVKGGLILTDPTLSRHAESRNYTVGPTVELKLPPNFGIETGFLYKRIGADYELRFDGARTAYRARGNSFEIPVVGKYYVRPESAWSPYLGLGAAVRRTYLTTQGVITNDAFPLPRNPFMITDIAPWGVGAVGAVGVQFRYGRWKVAPEFRYTRWSREDQAIPRNPNQVEFLVGVSF